jgi:hypothetical protein
MEAIRVIPEAFVWIVTVVIVGADRLDREPAVGE